MLFFCLTALRIEDDLRSRSTTAGSPRRTAGGHANLDLGDHLLDLSGLLFELRRFKTSIPFRCWATVDFNSVIAAYCAPDFFVFLEELVEKHCVDLVAADCVDAAVLVAYYQIRIHLRDFLGDQTKLPWTVLVAKSHRL
jgi:hypothetical protein